jgi:hypothetical protein
VPPDKNAAVRSHQIERRRRFEISERIGADGKIVTPLAD